MEEGDGGGGGGGGGQCSRNANLQEYIELSKELNKGVNVGGDRRI